mgnify:CR=1 FL=1
MPTYAEYLVYLVVSAQPNMAFEALRALQEMPPYMLNAPLIRSYVMDGSLDCDQKRACAEISAIACVP